MAAHTKHHDYHLVDPSPWPAVGSVAAFRGRTNGSIYAVAKAGMTHYTRCLADQLRPYDITVNCIAPGDTRTGRFLGTRAVDPNRLVDDLRVGRVDDLAHFGERLPAPVSEFLDLLVD